MKDIKNYEGLYAVTENGQVWSYKSQKFLKPYLRDNGYLSVGLHKDGIRKNHLIHRLVAEAYLPNPDNKSQVNHIDEDKSNNDINNLEWVSAKENINYGTRTERAVKAVSKLIYCVELNRTFDSSAQAARELGLCQSTITACCRGKRQTHGGYHWRYADELLG